jgi:transglutaminase-like putative cysteine protease
VAGALAFFVLLLYPLLATLCPSTSPAMVVSSRALHALPGCTPHAEVGRRRTIGSPQHPDGRVGGIQAVAWRESFPSSFPSPHRASASFFLSWWGRVIRRGRFPPPTRIRRRQHTPSVVQATPTESAIERLTSENSVSETVRKGIRAALQREFGQYTGRNRPKRSFGQPVGLRCRPVRDFSDSFSTSFRE